jgi:hypothetical protein
MRNVEFSQDVGTEVSEIWRLERNLQQLNISSEIPNFLLEPPTDVQPTCGISQHGYSTAGTYVSLSVDEGSCQSLLDELNEARLSSRYIGDVNEVTQQCSRGNEDLLYIN